MKNTQDQCPWSKGNSKGFCKYGVKDGRRCRCHSPILSKGLEMPLLCPYYWPGRRVEKWINGRKD